ncbi:prephenate dehydrogenase [Syntrophomonas palmitatica]|uniref:prephenate dehydrogenase n=1 Tax=Syntrophomonas palmitatica TaxID=402877 RepID=UPI0006CFFEE5|nr:prephenate dehydrogenase [Syntrophomonas palmitatica]
MLWNIYIIGLGLIGGSLGLALKDSPMAGRIAGTDTDTSTVKKALEMGAIDEYMGIAQGIPEADAVFLCTPLGSYPKIVETIAPLLKTGAVVSDVGSTKEGVMNLFQSLPQNVWKIGGHPMAGAEIKGINGADRYLFENAVYILTPHQETPPHILESFTALLETTGARMKILSSTRHDEIVASISHLPHLAAVAMVNLTGGDDEHLMMAAGGFRDTTRIASSNPELWEDILFSNREHLVKRLDELILSLDKMKAALLDGDKETMFYCLGQAKEIRDRIPRVHRGLMPGISELVCIVPDKPGIIGQLGAILSKDNINIVDIEILRVREGDGGTIRLGVPSADDAHRAVAALQRHSIKAWVR